MHHLYISIYNDAAALQQERESLVAWCEANGVKDYNFIEDDLTMGRISEKHIKALQCSDGEDVKPYRHLPCQASPGWSPSALPPSHLTAPHHCRHHHFG